HINLKKAKESSNTKKTESWKKFINDINPNTPIREAWEQIRLIEGIQFNETPLILIKGDKTYYSAIEKAQSLA
ncbi:Endo/exonuclease/phosphatase domain-containing protein, partial [Aphis craccivora]